MNFLSSNLKFLRKDKGLTQTHLAQELGINRAMIGAYEEERATPKIPVLQDICRLFEISMDQLISSDLSSGTDNTSFDISGSKLRILTTVVDSDNNEVITVVPAKASAGYLNGYADPEFIEQLPQLALSIPEMSAERTYRAFQINGDSMLPIQSGSYIIGEYVQNYLDVVEGDCYIVLTEADGIVYKRLYTEPNAVKLVSDNTEYEPYSVPLEEVTELWKAKGFISFDLPQQAASLQSLQAMMQKMQSEINNLKKQ